MTLAEGQAQRRGLLVYDRDTEVAVLGSALVWPEAAALVAAADSLMFCVPVHQAIAAAIGNLVDRGVVVDSHTVRNELRRTGEADTYRELERVLIDLQVAGATPKVVGNHLESIERDWHTRQAQTLTEDLRELLRNGGDWRHVVRALSDLADETTSSSLPSTWTAVDLAALRERGTDDQPPPALFERSDGVRLVYAGKVNAFVGESESAKSFGALIACRQELDQGHHAVYLDFEDDAPTVVGRMLSLGATWDQLVRQFHYIRPEEAITTPGASRALATALDHDPTIVVVDGVTEAMEMHGLDPLKQNDSARFVRLVVRPIADAGPGVIQIDHVGKNKEARGKGAIGAQHKRSAITGSQFIFETVKPLGRGRDGTVIITVDKDKPGHVRGLSTGRKVAELHVTSTPDGDHITYEIRPPEANTTGLDEQFRPTILMERVSRRLELHPDQTTNQIKADVEGRADYIAKAVNVLVSEGYVAKTVAGKSHLHHSIRPYREADDQGPINPTTPPT